MCVCVSCHTQHTPVYKDTRTQPVERIVLGAGERGKNMSLSTGYKNIYTQLSITNYTHRRVFSSLPCGGGVNGSINSKKKGSIKPNLNENIQLFSYSFSLRFLSRGWCLHSIFPRAVSLLTFFPRAVATSRLPSRMVPLFTFHFAKW